MIRRGRVVWTEARFNSGSRWSLLRNFQKIYEKFLSQHLGVSIWFKVVPTSFFFQGSGTFLHRHSQTRYPSFEARRQGEHTLTSRLSLQWEGRVLRCSSTSMMKESLAWLAVNPSSLSREQKQIYRMNFLPPTGLTAGLKSRSSNRRRTALVMTESWCSFSVLSWPCQF